MATFYLMQRVRVVRCYWPELIGREGTIVQVGDSPLKEHPYLVRVDGYPKALWGNSSHLEPLQLADNRLAAWEDVPGGRPQIEEIA